MNRWQSDRVRTSQGGGWVQKQGPDAGKQMVEEGRQGPEEEEEEEETGEMQAGSVELQVRAAPGEWEEVWGTRRCRGGEEGGSGNRRWEVGEMQGHSHLSLPAQRGRACRGGKTKHQQTDQHRKAKYGDFSERTHSTFFLYANEPWRTLTSKQRRTEHSALWRHLNLEVTWKTGSSLPPS